MSCYSLWIDGYHATQIAPHGPPTWETAADGGCGELSVTMHLRPGDTHQALRRGARVRVRLGTQSVYLGFLRDYNRETGELVAQGMAARNKVALDHFGSATLDVGVAIARAIANGWQVQNPDSIGGTLAGTVEGPQMVGELLTKYAESVAQRWGVDGSGNLYLRPDPTVPQWILAPGVAALGETGEGQATAIVARYFDGSGNATLIVGDYTGDEEAVDLTDRGTLGVMQVTAILGGALQRASQATGWTEGITVRADQLTTVGGTPAALADVKGGQMVRLTGVPVVTAGALWVDVVIGKTRYTAGEDVIYLEPVGTAPRNLADVIAAT